MSTKPNFNMKLLIDTKKQKVLVAEAGKECVDFIFHILSYPLGTVVSYVTKESMAGSLGSIYGSLETLEIDYVQEGLNKDCLLNPKISVGSSSQVPPLTMVNQAGSKGDLGAKKLNGCTRRNSVNFYGCKDHMNFSDTPGVKCPECKVPMVGLLTNVAPSTSIEWKGDKSVDGYVKGMVTYMITDDLSVQPMSMISTFEVLNKFGCELRDLEKREVTFDMDMRKELLKASLMSKTVLTDVFLGNKGAALK